MALATEQTLTTFASMLKEHWLPGIRKSFNVSSVLLDKFRRQIVTAVGGEYYLYPVHTAPNEAIGSRGEGVVLPDTSQQTYNQAKLYRSTTYGRFRMVLDAAKGNDTAIAALNTEMRALKSDMSADINRQLYGDGSGELTICGVTTASTSVEVVSTQHLRAGMPITIAQKSNGVALTGGDGTGSGDISSITDTDTFVFANTVTTAATDSVFRSGESGGVALAYNNAISGLNAICSASNPGYGTDANGYYAGINRTAVAGWQGSVLSNSGTNRALSLDLMFQAIHKAETAANGKIGLIVTTPALWRKYGLLMAGDRRWAGSVKAMDGGWKSLDFVGIPVVYDRQAPANKMYFLDLSTFDLLVENELSFMDRDGSVLVRRGSGASAYDMYEGTVYCRMQLGCNCPPASCLLSDLTE